MKWNKRYHPAQHSQELLEKIEMAFRAAMEKRGLLPTNPWKAKRVQDWLASMGARMNPGSHRFDPHRGCVDCDNFVNFRVTCKVPKVRIRGSRLTAFMRIEIPWEIGRAHV